MSDDNRNSESFEDFNFDSFIMDEPQTNTEESSFNLDNPFGDDLAAPSSETSIGNLSENTSENTEGSSLGFGNDPSFGGDAVTSESGVSADNPYFDDPLADSGVSADNPYLSDALTDESPDGKKKGKKGFLSGLLGGRDKPKKDKPKKEKTKKISLKKGESEEESEGEEGEEKTKKAKPKKEKAVKEKKPAGERAPLDLGTILCIAFSVFLLVSLLLFNIAAFLTRGPESSLMLTLCFMGGINIVGLAAASVPVLFYQFPKERTLLNVMLGVSAVALLTGVMIALTEFYRYGFAVSP